MVEKEVAVEVATRSLAVVAELENLVVGLLPNLENDLLYAERLRLVLLLHEALAGLLELLVLPSLQYSPFYLSSRFWVVMAVVVDVQS